MSEEEKARLVGRAVFLFFFYLKNIKLGGGNMPIIFPA
jgi:hypothetical protein